MALLLEQITAAQLESLSRDQTVFFLPVGPLEDHGPHLPLGLDLLEAQRLSELAAEKLERENPGWTGVIMPRAPLGIDTNTRRIAITVRGYVLRDWLVDSCRAMAKLGFRHFVCFSGHLGPKQLTAIEEAGRLLRRRGIGRILRIKPSLVSASSGCVDVKEFHRSALWPDPLEHGGRRDTSIGLAIAAEQVDPAYAALPRLAPAQPRWRRTWRRFRNQLSGYWGAPGEATPAEGQNLLQECLLEIWTPLNAVWKGANPEKLFRSWYSVIPPNKTFFKAWLIIVFLAIMMAAWVYLFFETVTNA